MLGKLCLFLRFAFFFSVLIIHYSFLCEFHELGNFYSPLGPFVPAPPAVAMRMLRDQGGPGPLEGNGDPRGRKGRSGPSAVGSGPVIAAVPPAFGQDPRRIRR